MACVPSCTPHFAAETAVHTCLSSFVLYISKCDISMVYHLYCMVCMQRLVPEACGNGENQTINPTHATITIGPAHTLCLDVFTLYLTVHLTLPSPVSGPVTGGIQQVPVCGVTLDVLYDMLLNVLSCMVQYSYSI